MKLAIPKKLKAAPARSKEEVEQMMKEEELVQAFTKEKIISYAAFIFLPPYSIYRIVKKNSPFRRSEKYMWTMMFIAYMAYLIQAIVF